MADSLAGVALAAGAGTRLRPLTHLRPKPLCPLGDSTLLDFALRSLGSAVTTAAVNVHHGAEQIEAHLDRARRSGSHDDLGGVHLSFEREMALGTAGALVQLRRWLEGRDVLVVNADTWHTADLAEFVDSWDGASNGVLTTSAGPFGPRSTVVASLVPASSLAGLPEGPCGLWEALWRHEVASGRMVTVHTDAALYDCGTPADYLAANLAWAAGSASAAATRHPGSVVGAGAVVEGTLDRCVVWPDSRVEPEESLRHAIRAEHATVLVR